MLHDRNYSKVIIEWLLNVTIERSLGTLAESKQCDSRAVEPQVDSWRQCVVDILLATLQGIEGDHQSVDFQSLVAEFSISAELGGMQHVLHLQRASSS